MNLSFGRQPPEEPDPFGVVDRVKDARPGHEHIGTGTRSFIYRPFADPAVNRKEGVGPGDLFEFSDLFEHAGHELLASEPRLNTHRQKDIGQGRVGKNRLGRRLRVEYQARRRAECADPAECKQIADLGVDFLACGIGNIHGVYPADWEGLQFDVLANIKEAVGDLPLVLHGGSGIPDDQIKKAIENGVSKINVNTECQIAFADATKAHFASGEVDKPKGFDPRKCLKPGFDAVCAKAIEKINLFGSAGKGWA